MANANTETIAYSATMSKTKLKKEKKTRKKRKKGRPLKSPQRPKLRRNR